MRIRALMVMGLLAMCARPAWAQDTTLQVSKLAVEDNAVVGGALPSPITSLTDVLRILGVRDVVNGAPAMRALVLDNDGDLLKDPNTSISTAGAWTWGGAGTFSSTLAVAGNTTITGNLIGGSGQLLVTSPARFSGTSLALAAAGMDNVRLGVSTGTPRVIWEDLGSKLWEVDNYTGYLRFIRTDATGAADSVAMQIADNIEIQPYGKRFLPVEPYGVDIGSQGRKFGAGWFGELIADTLVSIENIGTVDNRWLIGSGNMLDADLGPSDTTMIARYNNFAVGDYVYLQKFGKTEFVKIAAAVGLYNGITSNASFETGTVASWDVSASDSVTNTTTKSYHGERAMLVTSNAAGVLQIAYSGFAAAASTGYTACAFFRRVDGAAIAPGDIAVSARGGAWSPLTSEPTGTDGWYRGCAHFTAGTAPDTRAPYYNFVVQSVNYYVDAVQIEMGTTVRPFSETRFNYTILRNQDGIGVANQWFAGDGVFSTGGSSGYGWLDCYAFRGIKSAAEQGPACVANVRTGGNVFDWAPHAAWGNLNGIYGYGATTFGVAMGRQGDDYMTIEPTNGIRMFTNGVIKAQFYTTGEIGLGGQQLGDPHLVIRPSNLQFCIYGGACQITLDGATGSIDMTGTLAVGTGGAIRSGATGFETGTGYWLDYNAGQPRFRIGSPTTYLKWGADLELKTPTVQINSNGISIAGYTGGAWNDVNAYRFEYGDFHPNGLSIWGSTIRQMELRVSRNGPTSLELLAENSGGNDGQILIRSQNGATPSRIDLWATQLFVNAQSTFTGTCTGTITVLNGLIRSC